MFFFFFKQKTAYEMRISDWSSDVCSSDLPAGEDIVFFGPFGQRLPAVVAFEEERLGLEVPVDHAREIVALAERVAQHAHQRGLALDRRQPLAVEAELEHPQIGRAHV